MIKIGNRVIMMAATMTCQPQQSGFTADHLTVDTANHLTVDTVLAGYDLLMTTTMYQCTINITTLVL